MSEFYTRAEILAVDDQLTEEVAVPEWGGKKVLVGGLTGTDRDAFEAQIIDLKADTGQATVKLDNFRAKLVIACVIDPESHARLFSAADIAALGHKSGLALQRVFEVAQRLSGLSAQAVEELAKN